MQNKEVVGVEYGVYQQASGAVIDVIKIDNPFCLLEVAQQGAQVLSFYSKVKSKEVLWCTPSCYFKANKAIRGGIPFCFPWFGAHKTDKTLPAHGFARNSIWQLSSVEQLADQSHQLTFSLKDTNFSRQYWQHAFLAEMVIHCGEALTLEFKLTNTDQDAYEFGFAWHTYFGIDDIATTQIEGFHETSYFDQLTSQHGVHEGNIQFDQEFDRIYQDTSGRYLIKNNQSITQIDSPKCQSAVVWNPWQDKATRLGDVEPEGWRKFVCLECGQIGEKETLIQPQQQLTYRLNIQVL